MKTVQNKEHRFGQTAKYWHDRHDGVDYLFTDTQMAEARERARKNPEDIPASAWLGDFNWAVPLVIGLIFGWAIHFITSI